MRSSSSPQRAAETSGFSGLCAWGPGGTGNRRVLVTSPSQDPGWEGVSACSQLPGQSSPLEGSLENGGYRENQGETSSWLERDEAESSLVIPAHGPAVKALRAGGLGGWISAQPEDRGRLFEEGEERAVSA